MAISGNPEQLSQAELAVAFAIRFDSGNFELEDPGAIDDGVEAYRSLVRTLKDPQVDSNIAWSQRLWSDLTPSSPILGEAERFYDDGSSLSVMVRTDPTPDSPRQFEIATSLTVTGPEGPSNQRQIDYNLELGATSVIRKEDNDHGKLFERVFATAQKFLAADLSEETLGGLFHAALAEAKLSEEGIDPSLDPDVERARAESDEYREESDALRNDAANRELEAAFGVPNGQSVGTAELAALGQLLLSL